MLGGQLQMVQPVDGVLMDQQTLDMQALPRAQEGELHKAAAGRRGGEGRGVSLGARR